MKHWPLLVAVGATVAAAVFAALYFTKSSTTGAAAAACGEQRLFGHVSALTHKNRHLELRFDPALLTTGVTANTAAAQDGVVPPGQPVPNDSYVVDEGHRLFTYQVDPAARVTVLTRNGPGPLGETPIAVAELEHIVNGGPHRALFEPLDSGVWIRVRVDTICSLDQQYRP